MDSTGLEPRKHTPKGRIAVIQHREVGRLALSWQWARELRYVRRARKRRELSARTATQLGFIAKIGAKLASKCDELEVARRELVGIDCGAVPALGRLERCRGWVHEAGMVYRAAWAGRLSIDDATLDAIQIRDAAEVHVDLELRHDAAAFRLARELLTAPPAALDQPAEQPAAAAVYANDGDAFDARRATIRHSR